MPWLGRMLTRVGCWWRRGLLWRRPRRGGGGSPRTAGRCWGRMGGRCWGRTESRGRRTEDRGQRARRNAEQNMNKKIAMLMVVAVSVGIVVMADSKWSAYKEVTSLRTNDFFSVAQPDLSTNAKIAMLNMPDRKSVGKG